VGLRITTSNLRARRLRWIEAEGGVAHAGFVDVTDEPSIARMVAELSRRVGTHRHLHNNVGVSLAGGDAPIEDITADAFDRVTSINLPPAWCSRANACPIMRAQTRRDHQHLSMAAWAAIPTLPYKTSKAGVIAPHRTARVSERRVTASRERDPARAHEHADGDRVARGFGRQIARGCDRRTRCAAVPLGRRWAPRGISHTPPCGLLQTKAGFITGWHCRHGGASVKAGIGSAV